MFFVSTNRTRSIADYFAEIGYCAVVPKLLVPGLRGGTDGDGKSRSINLISDFIYQTMSAVGLPPDFNWAAEGAMQDFGGYMGSLPWEGDHNC